MTVLIKEYHPVLSISAPPSSIQAIRELMVANPSFSKANPDKESTISGRDNTVWLVAYSAERLRK
jgi:hypothetical protein